MTSAAVALADASEIDLGLLRRPGIRSDGNFHAKAALAQPDTVDGLRMQVVRDEFVVTLEVVVGDVKEDGAVLTFCAFAKDADGKLVTLEQRRKQGSDEGLFENLGEGLCGQERNEIGDEAVIGRGLDDHGELHGRSFHFDRGLGVGIEGAVDDVGPVDEVGDGLRVESEALLRDHRDEASAGFEIGIVELAVALVLLEVFGVGGRKKGAFVVIEPPSDGGGTRVLEIDDGVFVAVELLLIEQSAGTVDEAGEFKFGVAADALAIEAGEQSGGRRSVETLVVIKDSNSQSRPQSNLNSRGRVRQSELAPLVKANRIDSLEGESQAVGKRERTCQRKKVRVEGEILAHSSAWCEEFARI